MKPLSDSVRYRSFIHGRDRALETILHNAQLKVSDALRGCFSQIIKSTISTYAMIPRGTNEHVFGAMELDRIMKKTEDIVRSHFDKCKFEVFSIYQVAKRHSYLLAYTGEIEAIGRTMGAQTRRHITKADLDQVFNDPSFAGGSVLSRLGLTFKKLEQKILAAVHLSAVKGDQTEDLVKRMITALPQTKTRRNPKRILNKPTLQEAKRPDLPPEVSTGFVDEEEWDGLLNSYKEEFVPKYRSPEAEYNIRVPLSDESETIYGWELEQLLTQDFVYQVRQGQVDGAKENGVVDFIWVSVLDDVTDKCCEWRNGLLTSEIEQELNDKHKDDVCDAIVPPAHFNCRCTLSPATDRLPEKEPSNYGEFEEWLNNSETSS